MKYRKLGKSSLEISEVSFGGMSLPNNLAEAGEVIARAVDGGINFFDTADVYGHGENESVFGEALKPYRKQVLIATKVGNEWKPDKSGFTWNPQKQYIIRQVEGSLKRLQTDHIDLYQLHGGTIDDPIDETIEAFELLKHQGKIRYYGISSIRPNVIREYIRRSSIVSVMMQYSLLDRRPEELCFPLLNDAGIGILVRGSIAKGLLAGKPADQFLNYNKLDVHKLASAVKSISNDMRNTMQTAVNYVLSQTVVSSVVVGIRTGAQLDDALAIPDTLPLTPHELEYLSQILHQNFYHDHR